MVAILAVGDEIPASLLDAAGTALNPWVSYSPSWSSAGTAPAIGNGTLVGYYLQNGKTFDLRIRLVAGSSTTFGTGAWFFSVPVPRLSTENFDGLMTGLAVGGSSNRFIVVSQDSTTTTFSMIAAGSPTTAVSGTVPFTFASGHSLTLHGCYETP